MNNLVCYGVKPMSNASTQNSPINKNRSILIKDSILMNVEGMETTSILLIVGSIIGFILIVLLGIFIYLHCKKNREEKEKQLSKGFAMKVLDINEKIKEQKNKKDLDAMKKENQSLELQNEELKKIKEKQASELSSQDLNKSKEGSSIGLIRSDEKRLTPSSSLPLKMTAVDNETKLKENYSYLENVIKSKIQEVVLSEGGSGSGTRRGYEVVEKAEIDLKLENDIFRETQNSKQNNSIYEKHKKDIEDHKDVVDSEFSFREGNK